MDITKFGTNNYGSMSASDYGYSYDYGYAHPRPKKIWLNIRNILNFYITEKKTDGYKNLFVIIP